MSKHMSENRFYIEEEGIVFESFTDEPDIEQVSVSHGLKVVCKIDPGKVDRRKGEVYKSGTVQRLRKRERLTIPKELPVTDGCVYMLEVESCIMPDAAPNLVTVDIEKLRKAGVPEYVIDMILKSDEELSSLIITRSGRIILPEYKIEIKMPPLDKSLYFLYLRHPEGIRFKELCDHRDELTDIYASVSGRGKQDLIRESIDTLVDPLNNSINEKCSRIKRAFTKAFSPELARNYYIDGKSGEPKSIALDRSYVTWETLRF